MDWRLALITFSVLPLIVLVTQWFRQHVRESYRAGAAAGSRGSTPFCRKTSPAWRRCSCSGARRATTRGSTRSTRAHRDANVKSIFYYAVFYPAIELVSALAGALIIWWGGGWAMEGTLTLGALVAFLQYSQRFFRPISDMSEKFNLLQAAMASSERIFKLLDTRVEVKPPRASRCRGPDGRPGPHRLRARLVRLSRTRTWCCATSRSRCHPASASASSAPRRGKDARSSACCCGSTTFSAGASWSTASTSVARHCADLRSLFGLVLQDVHLFSGTIAAQHPARRSAALPTSRCGAPPRRCTPTRFIERAAAAATRRRSPSEAPRCRSDRNSCSPSRARSRSTRRCSCSTRRRRASIPTPRPSSATRCTC